MMSSLKLIRAIDLFLDNLLIDTHFLKAQFVRSTGNKFDIFCPGQVCYS